MEEKSSWKGILADRLKSLDELLAYLDIQLADLTDTLPDEQQQRFAEIHRAFPVLVPKPFADLMKKGDPLDPLLRQVLPDLRELVVSPGFSHDPLGELEANPVPGLLHKYSSRALMLAVQACPVHCRYCFRRHFPYAENRIKKDDLMAISNYIKHHPEINEIILSGGDPLSLGQAQLDALGQALFLSAKGQAHSAPPCKEGLPQLRRLRIHTRFPVTIPQRVDAAFLEWVSALSIPLVMVLHINHKNEIGVELKEVVKKLNSLNVRVYSQSVLLRGVNDSAQALVDLCEALFDASIQPYYLHLMDRVQGAAHFVVGEEPACELMREVQQRLPGFLLPRLVREDAGFSSKTIIY